MNFKSLYKLYVMNNISTFNDIYREKINSSSTIKFDILINNYQSFFTYDVEIMKLVSKIRDIDATVSRLFSKLPALAVAQYMRKSLIDEIAYTNEIEGVVSTRKDINDLINEIEKKIKTKNRFEGIVNKYLMLTKEKLNLVEATNIREIYDEMLYNEIKQEDKNNLPDSKIFRKEEVHVLRTTNKIIHNGIMPEDKIIEYMNKTLDILNDSSIDILIRVSLVHYYFGFIHPFYDGNGRINRFISSYVLAKNLNEIVGFRLSMTIKENLTQYLDAFVHTNDIRNRADVSTFVYEFLDIVYKSYLKTELYALEKTQEYNKYLGILEKIDNIFIEYKNQFDIKELLNILIQASIFGDFGITKAEMCQLLNKGNTKITEFLTILKSKDLIVENRSGKYRYYQVDLEKLNIYNKDKVY